MAWKGNLSLSSWRFIAQPWNISRSSAWEWFIKTKRCAYKAGKNRSLFKNRKLPWLSNIYRSNILWRWHSDSCITEWHFSFHTELPWPDEAWIYSLSLSPTVPWSASKTILGVVGHFNAWQLWDGGVSLLLPSCSPPSLQTWVSGSYQYIKPPNHPTTLTCLSHPATTTACPILAPNASWWGLLLLFDYKKQPTLTTNMSWWAVSLACSIVDSHPRYKCKSWGSFHYYLAMMVERYKGSWAGGWLREWGRIAVRFVYMAMESI